MIASPLYSRLMLILILLGIGAFSAAAPAPMLAVFALPAAYIGWRLSTREGKPWRMPALAVHLLLMAAIAFAVYRSTTYGFEVTYIAELVVFLQLIKLGDRRGPRDDAQILALSVFLAIAAMLTSNTLWVGAILAFFLPILIAVLMLFQLHKGAALAAQHGGELHQVQALPGVGSDFIRHFRRTAVFATIATLLAAAAIFIIMPRGVGENAFGRWGGPQQRSITGFTDRVTLGSRGVISTSPTIVLDLTVRELSSEGHLLPMGSGDSVHYLRGAVLDIYEDGVWLPSRHLPGGDAKRIQHGVDLNPGEERTIAQATGPLLEQTIALRYSGAEHRATRLFAAWRPVRIQTQRRSRLTIHYHDGIFERTGEPGPLSYTVWSAITDRPLPFERSPASESRTPTSFNSQPLQALAAQILAEAAIDPDPAVRPIHDDSRAARAIQDHLRANFEYSLEEQYIPPQTHPIEHFIFTTRRGHCEYFASAMVAMCRSVGIHARMVTGYVAAEFNQASGHYTVRESNAHAWVEVEIGSAARGRWYRFDPTPPSDLVRIHRPRQTLVGRFRQMLDAVEYAWNSSIVGFDAGRRERLLGRTPMAALRDSPLIQRLDSLAAPGGSEGGRPTFALLARMMLIFSTLALPAAGVVLAWRLLWPRLKRRRRPRRRALPARSEDPAFYRALLEVLARRGHPKPAWSPPLAHAQSLPAEDLAQPAADLANLYYRSRFAGTPLTAADLHTAEELLARLAAPAQETRR
jgi:protein-glutamine gamma-glutamyltransferase